MSIKYIVDFDTQLNSEQQRGVAPAGVDKAHYIAESIATATGGKVKIISCAGTTKKSGYVKKTEYAVDSNISVRLFATFGAKNKILKGIRYYLLLIKLFLYLLFTVQKGEKIIVYHTMKTAGLIYWVRKIKKCYLILEAEEVYSDVRKYPAGKVKNEYRLIECADAYIFPTSLMEKKFNKGRKPCVIIHGIYKVEKAVGRKYNDGKIHCVYAGTFDRIKGGAEAAVRAAEFLDGRYHVHIIGFGREDEKKYIENLISEISAKTECKLTFDGMKQGEEYKKFIQSCHIGLSTQNSEKEFNNTSFPSKVLSYLVNGLNVASVKIPVLESSEVDGMISYCESNEGNQVADAIMRVDVTKQSPNEKIMALDTKFKEEMKKMTEDIK